MAKITRKLQKIFGSNAGGTGVTEFGSTASGSTSYSTDPDDIQTANWLVGWLGGVLAGAKRLPTYEDRNAVDFVTTRQLAYLFQEGIPEYESGTEYHQNSIVKKSGTYELYGSLINTNTGNTLPSQVDDANWQYLGDLAELENAGIGFAPVGTSLYQTTGTAVPSNTWTTIGFDTELYDDGDWHDNVTNNERITVDFDGRISVNAMVDYNRQDNATLGIRVYRNATIVHDFKFVVRASGSQTNCIETTADIDVSNGDYIYIDFFEDVGLAITTKTGIASTKLQAHRIK